MYVCLYTYLFGFCGVLVSHGSVMTVQYDVAISFYFLCTCSCESRTICEGQM